MSTPDPDSFGLLGKTLGALAVVGTVVVAPIWAARNWMDKRFATKHNVREAVQPLVNQQAEHGKQIAKLFDRLEEADAKNEERHRELLMHLLERKGD